MIKVKYSSVDRFRKTGSFKTLKGARKFAQSWIGKYPEMGSSYAVSGDGIGKIEVQGCALAELFGEEKPTAPPSKVYVVHPIGKCFATRAEAQQDIDALIKGGYGAYGPYEIQELDAEGLFDEGSEAPDFDSPSRGDEDKSGSPAELDDIEF